ncbi:MAG: 50S ribosomal protein L6 [Defluviitaleaceae bacterium]|nr:50S ribosomal protein L6 [Defluviitaleaceae bacterium]
MSRIGKLPVTVPAGVTVDIGEGNVVTVKGPLGTLTRRLCADMNIARDEGKLEVTRPNDLKKNKALHGLTRTLLNNMVVGVATGYTKKLEINGTGYRAEKRGDKLMLTLGYSHPIEMKDPEGVASTVEGNNRITITGIDKEKVGQYAADIRSKREPEPFKGKGIKYDTEKIRRKAGKAGKK